MTITRTWGMPNRWTFQIKPIAELLGRYRVGAGWLDPFAGQSQLAEFRNDIDPKMDQPSSLPADVWLGAVMSLGLGDIGPYCGIVFDPPYSGRQVKECYTELKRHVHRDDTNAYFYAAAKRAAAPLIRLGGHAITCGWNTNGFGESRGFEIIEILLVPHGSAHNDTIVTVERKVSHGQPKT